MNNKWLILSFSLIALPARAQIIHEYPYAPITSYSSPASYPSLSAQCHWRPGNSNVDMTMTPQLMSPSIAHTHVDSKSPIYSEQNANFVIPFVITLFHVDGHLDPHYATMFGPLIDNVVWDTIDGLPPPVMEGDPNGIVTFSGHVTVDFSLADGSNNVGLDIPKHGWFIVSLSTRTYFNNGDSTDTLLGIPFYSTIDTSQPETVLQGGGHRTSMSCDPHSSRDNPPGAIGGFSIRVDDYLPLLAPITVPLSLPTPLHIGYVVGAGLPASTGMIREDMDLHNGIAGTLLRSATAFGDTVIYFDSVFSPAILGNGTHKVAFIRQQDTGSGAPGIVSQEQAAGLLVVTVNINDGGPINPPPVEVWSNWILQHGDISNSLRACPDTTGIGCIGIMKTN